jgi:hypothetical protein
MTEYKEIELLSAYHSCLGRPRNGLILESIIYSSLNNVCIVNLLFSLLALGLRLVSVYDQVREIIC